MALEWVALAISAALAAYGFFEAKLFSQQVWSPEGLRGVALFTAGYAAYAGLLSLPRLRPWFLHITGALFVCWSIVRTGIAGPAAALFVLAALFAIGRLLRCPPSVAVAAGLALVVSLFGLTAAVPIHFRWTWLILLMVPLVLWRGKGLSIAPLRLTTSHHAGLVLLVWILLAHGLIALKPEVSNDGLAMHLAAPSIIAVEHRWSFDVTRFLWSVMPMNGDWLYSIAYLIGGEFAARLTNFGVLLSLTALLISLVRPFGNPYLMAALFVSAPLVQLVTGSLFVENVTALLILASFALLLDRDHPNLYALALVAGAAVSSKYAALLFVLPACLLLLRKFRVAPFLLFLVVASQPYLNAYLRTGNPVFPFFDPALNIQDPRFHSGLHWYSLYDATFHSHRYLESLDGSLGFTVFVLSAAAAIALLRRGSALPQRAALFLGLLYCALSFASQSNLRYLYPALPLLTIGFAAAPAPAIWALIPLNVYFLASSGGYHRDFLAGQDQAPERSLIRYLNESAPGQPAAFFDSNNIAELRGRAYTTSWHDPQFAPMVRNAERPETVDAWLRARSIRWIVAPVSGQSASVAADFLSRCAEPRLTSGRMQLLELRAACTSSELRAAVGPGDYDDTNPAMRYFGAWQHDTQFAEAAGHTLTYSNSAGASAELEFRGQSVTLVATYTFNRGIADVLVDGTLVQSVDLYSPTTRWRQSVRIPQVEPALHHLTVRVTGRTNLRSSGAYVDIDRIEIR